MGSLTFYGLVLLAVVLAVAAYLTKRSWKGFLRDIAESTVAADALKIGFEERLGYDAGVTHHNPMIISGGIEWYFYGSWFWQKRIRLLLGIALPPEKDLAIVQVMATIFLEKWMARPDNLKYKAKIHFLPASAEKVKGAVEKRDEKPPHAIFLPDVVSWPAETPAEPPTILRHIVAKAADVNKPEARAQGAALRLLSFQSNGKTVRKNVESGLVSRFNNAMVNVRTTRDELEAIFREIGEATGHIPDLPKRFDPEEERRTIWGRLRPPRAEEQ